MCAGSDGFQQLRFVGDGAEGEQHARRSRLPQSTHGVEACAIGQRQARKDQRHAMRTEVGQAFL
jgi:hypothetical protein